MIFYGKGIVTVLVLFLSPLLKGMRGLKLGSVFEDVKEILSELGRGAREYSTGDDVQNVNDILKFIASPFTSRSDPRVQFVSSRIKTDSRLEALFHDVLRSFKDGIEVLPDEAIAFIVEHHGLRSLLNELLEAVVSNKNSGEDTSEIVRQSNEAVK